MSEPIDLSERLRYWASLFSGTRMDEFVRGKPRPEKGATDTVWEAADLLDDLLSAIRSHRARMRTLGANSEGEHGGAWDRELWKVLDGAGD